MQGFIEGFRRINFTPAAVVTPPPVPKYNRLSQKGRRKRAKW